MPHLNTLLACAAERAAIMADAAALADDLFKLSRRLVALTQRSNQLTRAAARLIPAAAAGDPIATIKFMVADHFGQTVQAIESHDRHDLIVWPRHVAIFLCRQLLPKVSLSVIAGSFNRDHSAIIHAIRAVQDRLDCEPNRREDLRLLSTKIQLKIAKPCQ